MTGEEREVFEMRYGKTRDDCVKVKENKYGEVTMTKRTGEILLYDPKVGFTRKLPRDSYHMSDKEFAIEFGKRLKARLRYADMTQNDLALKIGASQHQISRYINGHVIPGFRTVDKIAKAIGCSADDLRYID